MVPAFGRDRTIALEVPPNDDKDMTERRSNAPILCAADILAAALTTAVPATAVRRDQGMLDE